MSTYEQTTQTLDIEVTLTSDATVMQLGLTNHRCQSSDGIKKALAIAGGGHQVKLAEADVLHMGG
eukprot:scaffold4924_cov27-Prasinocladus_malaysianus.AAC.2